MYKTPCDLRMDVGEKKKNICYDSGSPDRDSNLEPTENDKDMLTTTL